MSLNSSHKPGVTHKQHGLLWHIYRWMRGTEQILIRPAAELPLVLASYTRGDEAGLDEFRRAIEETWPALPERHRFRYREVLAATPSFVVVELRRKNICTCLGHHHPQGTGSRLMSRLQGLSGVRTGEVDLAYEAIREWEPQPLSHMALPIEPDHPELRAFQYQLALLTVFLHELNHLVAPQESEFSVRSKSQKFYDDLLGQFIAERFGVHYGLRAAGAD
jgi:hypothetical protein